MPTIERLLPCIGWLRRYDGAALRGDGLAAVIVTIMLIPQSLAYALLAGLPPEVGLYASMLPLLGYALFGSSNALAVGPVAVVSLMTAAAVGEIAASGTPEYLGAALAPRNVPVYVTDTGEIEAKDASGGSARKEIRQLVSDAYLGITSADFCMADTASLVMRTRPGQARSASLVPSIHVAVIYLEQVILDLNAEGDVNRGGVSIVGTLAHVDVVVWMYRLFRLEAVELEDLN